MKRIYLLISIIGLFLCVFLMACTPEKPQETEAKLPVGSVPSISKETGTTLEVPASTWVTEELSQTATTEIITVSTQSGISENTTETEFSGLDIEDEHIETLGEDIGVGGN